MDPDANATDAPIPDKPHPRAVRSAGGWLVRRVSARKVRVTSEHGYVDVRLGPGATASGATRLASHAIDDGLARWTPVRKPSGPSGGAAAARAADSELLRVEVTLGVPAAAALAAQRSRYGSNRAVIERALLLLARLEP